MLTDWEVFCVLYYHFLPIVASGLAVEKLLKRYCPSQFPQGGWDGWPTELLSLALQIAIWPIIVVCAFIPRKNNANKGT